MNCVHVGELGMSRADDSAILSFAREQNAVLVTLDADFHSIVGVSGASAPSVIRIRIQGLAALAVTETVKTVIHSWHDDLLSGTLITVKPNNTTRHRLPINRAGDP